MVKRARDVFDSGCDSPAPSSPPKRQIRLSYSSPIRPRASSHSTPFAYTIRTPLSVPQDSPTNPFGLKRTLAALELPRPTAFGKHICLRFQLVDTRLGRTLAAKRRDAEGGIHRVVQVPLNYTFRHLHKLILFLFASDISDAHSQLPSARRTSLRSTSRSRSPEKGKARAGPKPASSQWGGHFFEVLKPAAVHPNSTKPGVIKAGGTVRTKLSSVRERRLFGDLLDPENAASSSSDLPKTLEDEDVEKGDWTWEAEDDFTLGKVWRRGPSNDRGVIYRHQPDISIHVTANTLPVPPRKGSGNTPHVFHARGNTGELVRIAHVVPTQDGGEAVFPLPSSDLEHLLHPLTQTHIDRWNREGAFPRFLQREAERERALQRAPPSPRMSASVSPKRAPMARPRDPSETPTTVPSSDPMFPSSEPESDASDLSMCSAYSDGAIFPFALSAITPYPAHPLHRKRMQRAERRMARITKSGLVDMISSDEEEAKKKKGKGKDKGKDKGKEKATESVNDEDADGEVEEHDEEVKENVKEPVMVNPFTKRVPRAQQTGRSRGSMRGRKPPPVMDVIEWTPAPDDEDDQYAREWGSVEV